MENIEKLKTHLNLQPLPQEGGFYCETYRSGTELPVTVLPDDYPERRSLSTAIFYLLTPESQSALHKLPGDEVYHFYLGDPVELLQLPPEGSAEVITLGQDIFDDMKLQHVVPGGVFQGARLAEGGTYALLGTTMAPGFEFDDFTPGGFQELADRYPEFKQMIADLT